MLIFVIGAPGSGKGTLCELLVKHLGYAHLSIGDQLRKLVAAGEQTLDPATVDRIRRCELLTVDELGPIVQDALSKIRREGSLRILLDGFPRDFEQAIRMERIIGAPETIIFFDCPEDVARNRYLTRALPGRDANEDVFKKRYDEFRRLNPAIVQEYEKRGVLLKVSSGGETCATFGKLLQGLKDFGVLGEEDSVAGGAAQD